MLRWNQVVDRIGLQRQLGGGPRHAADAVRAAPVRARRDHDAARIAPLASRAPCKFQIEKTHVEQPCPVTLGAPWLRSRPLDFGRPSRPRRGSPGTGEHRCHRTPRTLHGVGARSCPTSGGSHGLQAPHPGHVRRDGIRGEDEAGRGGRGLCPRIGRRRAGLGDRGPFRTTAVNAALANGMCAHADETDDFEPITKAHPGSCVVPAALAMAEKEGRSGEEFVRAVALGYGLTCNLLMALGPDHVRATHRSAEGTSSTFGALGAAASLARLDEKACASPSLMRRSRCPACGAG